MVKELEDKAVLAQLGDAVFTPLGCRRYGVGVQANMAYEQLIEHVGLSHTLGGECHLEHDFAGAPFLANSEGKEQAVGKTSPFACRCAFRP